MNVALSQTLPNDVTTNVGSIKETKFRSEIGFCNLTFISCDRIIICSTGSGL